MNPPVIQTTYNFIPEIYNSTFKADVFAREVYKGIISLFIKIALAWQKGIGSCTVLCKLNRFNRLGLQIIIKH